MVFAFNRDVPYTGDQALWSFSTATGRIADLRMHFSARGDATIHGICTEAECKTVDSYLEDKMYYLRNFVLPDAGRHVEIHNGIVAESAAAFLRRFEAAVQRYRSTAAKERRMPAQTPSSWTPSTASTVFRPSPCGVVGS